MKHALDAEMWELCMNKCMICRWLHKLPKEVREAAGPGRALLVASSGNQLMLSETYIGGRNMAVLHQTIHDLQVVE